MNHKKFIPMFAVAVILPAMYFGGIVPMTVTSYGMSPAFEKPDLVEKSELAVQGELIDRKSFVEWQISGNNAIPSVYTVWTLQQSESLKGNAGNVIEFVVGGGEYNNIRQTLMHDTELSKGDNVIVFLSKDADSVYKDNYHITGIESGIFKIENRVATNSFMDSSEDTDSMKQTLRSLK